MPADVQQARRSSRQGSGNAVLSMQEERGDEQVAGLDKQRFDGAVIDRRNKVH